MHDLFYITLYKLFIKYVNYLYIRGAFKTLAKWFYKMFTFYLKCRDFLPSCGIVNPSLTEILKSIARYTVRDLSLISWCIFNSILGFHMQGSPAGLPWFYLRAGLGFSHTVKTGKSPTNPGCWCDVIPIKKRIIKLL